MLLSQYQSLSQSLSHYSCDDQDRHRDHLRDVPSEDICRLNNSAAATESCEWVHAGIDYRIPHCKHQGKPHSFK